MWACNLVMAIFLLLLLQERLAAILSILEIYIYNSKETSAHCPITEEADMALGYCPLLPAPPCSFSREEIVGPFELPSLTSLHLHDTPRAARSILRDMVMIYFSKSPGGSVCFSGWIMILKTIINFYVFFIDLIYIKKQYDSKHVSKRTNNPWLWAWETGCERGTYQENELLLLARLPREKPRKTISPFNLTLHPFQLNYVSHGPNKQSHSDDKNNKSSLIYTQHPIPAISSLARW